MEGLPIYFEPVRWKCDRTLQTITRDEAKDITEVSTCGVYAKTRITGNHNDCYWVRCADLERDNLTRLVIFRQTDRDHPDMITPAEMMEHVRKYSRKVAPSHTRKGKLTGVNTR